MFGKGKENYRSDVKLGERYRDPQSGIEGVATAIYFFQYACERVQLELLNRDGELKEYSFDAPRLVHIETKEPVRTDRTGGPGLGVTSNPSVRPGPR